MKNLTTRKVKNFYQNVSTLNPTFYLHLFFGFPKIKKKKSKSQTVAQENTLKTERTVMVLTPIRGRAFGLATSFHRERNYAVKIVNC